MNLNTELNIEKNNNQNLSQRIKELEKIINIKGGQNLIDKSNINLNNEIKNLIKINELYEEIRIKDKIISDYPVQLSEGEKLLSVIFISSDQKVHYSVICKNTDKFNKIENMLYDEYPEYSESENHFLVNGKKVNKYKTLEYNKIKNNDIIMLKNM